MAQDNDNDDAFEALCRRGDVLRKEYEKVRHITEVLYDGGHWTLDGRWEHYDERLEEWVEID